jgi:hypothetical protein
MHKKGLWSGWIEQGGSVRSLFVLLFMVTALFSAEVVALDKKYQKSKNCMPCHKQIVQDWQGSWHAKSHFNKDEYFKKSLEYVSRKSRQSLNAVKVKCAKCHNPRISVTKTDESYEIAAVMGLDKESSVAKAVTSDTINEGINCVVCHNVDKIHYNYPKDKRGIERVEWTPSGVMTGPYKDAKSPYHKIVTHEFMNDKVNELCLVCHANDRSIHGLIFTDMEAQYKVSGSSEKCVSCHMGTPEKGVASNYPYYNGKTRTRLVRKHSFSGAHKAEMLKDALQLSLQEQHKRLAVTLINKLPHNIPSGFGARELLVVITFYNESGVIEAKNVSLTRYYKRKKGRTSIPHTAIEMSSDTSIPAKSEVTLHLETPQSATRVKVDVFYRLVNDEVRHLLKLKEAIWSKKFPITSKEMKL